MDGLVGGRMNGRVVDGLAGQCVAGSLDGWVNE